MHQSVFHDLPLPAGAEYADDWQPGDIEFPPYRIVLGAKRGITDHALLVSTSAVQWVDGSIEDGSKDECPKVWLDQPGDLNSDQARELAALLLELAAQIDGWVQR